MREGYVKRETQETKIELALDIDGQGKNYRGKHGSGAFGLQLCPLVGAFAGWCSTASGDAHRLAHRPLDYSSPASGGRNRQRGVQGRSDTTHRSEIQG